MWRLIFFLLRKRALLNFIRNYEPCDTYSNVWHFMMNVDDPIGAAFTWAITEQGFDYWAKLRTEYERTTNII